MCLPRYLFISILLYGFTSANPLADSPPCHVTLNGTCYDLVQGDIIVPRKPTSLKGGIQHALAPHIVDDPRPHSWTDGVIPYELDASISSQQRCLIFEAFFHISDKTCVRFVLRSSQREYISISNRNAECFSEIGKSSPTNVNLGDGCFTLGTIVHELMHAMGFKHEQSRPDRDDNVEIKWDNIAPGISHNFYIENKSVYFGTPYDFGSVMHYGTKDFSHNGKPTIVAKRPYSGTIGQREGLSVWDRVEINQLYRCSKPKQFFILDYRNLANVSGMNDRDHAMPFCGKYGGRPGMMKSDDEFRQASRLKQELGSESVWVGMKRAPSGDAFLWDDGTLVTKGKWGTGEPNNFGGSENCAMMLKRSGGDVLEDLPCRIDKDHGVLCESYPSLTYFVLTRGNLMSRDDAAKECQKVGARMAMTKNQQEYEATVQVKLDSGVEYAWIGMSRLSTDQNSWRWDDGERLSTASFSKWSSGEPNNFNGSNEHCVLMWYTNQWNDFPCKGSLFDFRVKSVICERGRNS